MSVRSTRKGRNDARGSPWTSHCPGRTRSLFSRLAMKSEVATWTIIDGSPSPRRACNSLRIHGSILCKILSFTPSFMGTLWNFKVKILNSISLPFLHSLVIQISGYKFEQRASNSDTLTTWRRFLEAEGTACNRLSYTLLTEKKSSNKIKITKFEKLANNKIQCEVFT